MVDLTKFSKEDLKKTAAEINAYLKKADETDFDPRATEVDTTHNEEDIGGTSSKPSIPKGEGEKKSADVKKDDMMGGGDDQQMTDASQTDVLSQVLEKLDQILAAVMKTTAPAPTAPPTDQVQMSVDAPSPVATPSTTPTPTGTTEVKPKGDININVHKSEIETAVAEVLKGMGITPSGATPKPKAGETGHPIEKGANAGYKDIAKMSWDEIYNLDQQMKGEQKAYF